jgi:hypothetical protein
MNISVESKAKLRKQIPLQVWLTAGGIAVLGLLASLAFIYLIVQQKEIDKLIKNERQSAIGVITALEHTRGRRDGYWQPRVTLEIPQRGKIEIRDSYLRIAADASAGEVLKKQYIGSRVEVEYLSDLSVIRVSSSYENDKENQIGYKLFVAALGFLLCVPFIVVWCKPHWAISRSGSDASNLAKSQLRKRRRR